MNLVIIRHAIAESRELFAESGKSDSLRPLTQRGRKRMKENLRGICKIVPEIQLIATSELTRAIQTAEIVSKSYKNAPLTQTSTLNPDGKITNFVDWLRSRSKYETIGIVGHEPYLGKLISCLVNGNPKESFLIKKGSLAVVHFHTTPIAGTGQLHHLVQPTNLRQLGRINCD